MGMFQEKIKMTGLKKCMDYKVEDTRPGGRPNKTRTHQEMR